jgi:hypothetical protein
MAVATPAWTGAAAAAPGERQPPLELQREEQEERERGDFNPREGGWFCSRQGRGFLPYFPCFCYDFDDFVP